MTNLRAIHRGIKHLRLRLRNLRGPPFPALLRSAWHACSTLDGIRPRRTLCRAGREKWFWNSYPLTVGEALTTRTSFRKSGSNLAAVQDDCSPKARAP